VLALVAASISAAALISAAVLAGAGLTTRRRIDSSPDGPEAESLDAAAITEIQRARRYQRPLTIVAFGADRRTHAATIAAQLRTGSRVNDIVGYLGRSTVIAVLPETDESASTAVVQRLAQGLRAEVASRVRVGVTSFPTDEVTWAGLRESIGAVTRPLHDFHPSQVPAFAEDLAPRRIAERSDAAGAQVGAPAHAVDPAA
jgi:hypothetical protein